ncbi:hypothetical protein [Arthrobacter sp. 2MCAF14]|uniref:hypothetical protein n=1 Tax=Arthrobacter sp. 2MCAF14 TaxID=3232982 RepID=UPI003F8DBD9A
MSKTTTRLRIVTATTGAVILSYVGSAAIAADVQHGDGEVDVTVEIAKIDPPGVLALSVAGTSAALTENGSNDLVRQFTGSLPTVTVTDTRAADTIPAGAHWYVLGTATDFTGGAGKSTIGARYLGWAPRLIDGGASGLVAQGDPVTSAVDNTPANVGLVDRELLAMAADSGAVATEGKWTATADLALRVPSTVTPGAYTSKLTLSLFE